MQAVSSTPATCFREPRPARCVTRRDAARPDTRHATRVLCCQTQSKIRQATAVAAICRQPEQTESGRALLQKDSGRCPHRAAPRRHGEICLGLERTGASYGMTTCHDLEGSVYGTCSILKG